MGLGNTQTPDAERKDVLEKKQKLESKNMVKGMWCREERNHGEGLPGYCAAPALERRDRRGE